MRFIGNKTNLLENIKAVIDENCMDQSEIFCDIFSGTGSVSRFFKQYYYLSLPLAVGGIIFEL